MMFKITEDSSEQRHQLLQPSVSRKAFPREGGNHHRRSTGNGLASGSAFSVAENSTGISNWVKFS